MEKSGELNDLKKQYGRSAAAPGARGPAAFCGTPEGRRLKLIFRPCLWYRMNT
ncbi:hypothetical protein CLOSTASPAR_05403 [[Clostridium] asparagiforme DSM 15981]|uniref:Uncharacterized protein n=1 Tax=[Clostridium] asparagiforme DSM 15981 TaxID=518636 RepID=C0D805_9FIRM|nr:hypothetical protein CLOSTASPAR_05403 [[Clostridium] asparagiforme DSM 15981]